MIIIANPIYDVVTKALLDDLEIARGFLSALIGMTILELRLISQEHIRKDQKTGDLIAMRLDFCAVVRTKDGRTFQVIIELQKAKIGTNPLRFRFYLASRYMSTEEFYQDGETHLQSLPIISIYLLGYTLDKNLPMATKVQRGYYNAVTGRAIKKAKPNEFIEQLSHDSIFVQIPKINGQMGTELERVLSVSDQHRKLADDQHRLEMDEKLVKSDPLLGKIYRALNRIQESPEMEKIMTLEDIFLIEQQEEAAIARRQLKEEQERLKESQKQLEEAKKRREEEQKWREEEQKRREEEQKRREEEQKRREEEQKRREEAEEEVARLRKLLQKKEKPPQDG